MSIFFNTFHFRRPSTQQRWDTVGGEYGREVTESTFDVRIRLRMEGLPLRFPEDERTMGSGPGRTTPSLLSLFDDRVNPRPRESQMDSRSHG